MGIDELTSYDTIMKDIFLAYMHAPSGDIFASLTQGGFSRRGCCGQELNPAAGRTGCIAGEAVSGRR